jgi:hypothetical protein
MVPEPCLCASKGMRSLTISDRQFIMPLTNMPNIEAKENEMWKKESSVTAERVPGAMATYRESVDEFSKNATEFLEHIPTLTKARDAYQRAMTVSTELRSILDTGDETMKSLMTQRAGGKHATGKREPGEEETRARQG